MNKENQCRRFKKATEGSYQPVSTENLEVLPAYPEIFSMKQNLIIQYAQSQLKKIEKIL